MHSIIIPVYNEERNIAKLLDYLVPLQAELVVVDGGSTDKTIAVVEQYPVKIIKSAKGRARQMNKGASQANGDILIFLHADCLPEEGFLETITRAIDNDYIGGCLTHTIDSDSLIYRWIEASGNIRARISKVFYGDQCIFVRKDIFERLGAYDEVELFEDVIFSRKLKKEGLVAIFDKKVLTSSRRWKKQGLAKVTLINWIIGIAFMFGVSTERLRTLYEDVR